MSELTETEMYLENFMENKNLLKQLNLKVVQGKLQYDAGDDSDGWYPYNKHIYKIKYSKKISNFTSIF